MSEIKIEIDQDDIKALLHDLDPDQMWRAIGRGLGVGARRVWQNLPSYPPPPADSSYRRTGELGRRMYVGDPVVTGNGASVEIGDNRPGAGFVIGPRSGDPHQAFMHVGRWWQLDVEMEKGIGAVTDAVDDELRRLFGR